MNRTPSRLLSARGMAIAGSFLALGAVILSWQPTQVVADDPTPAPYFIMASIDPDCPANALLDEQYITPTGQLSNDFAAGDGTAYTYDDGDGDGGTITLTFPPEGWQPTTASDDELKMYNFDPRPSDPDALAQWNAQYSNFQGFYLNPPCNPTEDQYTSIPLTSGCPPTCGNWSGEGMDKHTGYIEAFASFKVEHYGTCSVTSGMSDWVGLTDVSHRVVQAGVESIPTGHPQGDHLFWEQLNVASQTDDKHDYSFIALPAQ